MKWPDVPPALARVRETARDEAAVQDREAAKAEVAALAEYRNSVRRIADALEKFVALAEGAPDAYG